jgi:hypothetical protein
MRSPSVSRDIVMLCGSFTLFIFVDALWAFVKPGFTGKARHDFFYAGVTVILSTAGHYLLIILYLGWPVEM